MQTYFVRRTGIAASASDLDAALTHLREIEEEPGIRATRWIHSYAVREPDGRFGLACIFEAECAGDLRAHALRTRLPAAEILPVAATLGVREFAPALVHMVRRRSAWPSLAQVQATAGRARVVGEQMAREVCWLRSYVVGEDDGTFGSFCIYQAVSAHALRTHAARAGMRADDIAPVLGRIVFRRERAPQPAP